MLGACGVPGCRCLSGCSTFAKESAGWRCRMLPEFCRGTGKEQLSAIGTGTGSEVKHPVGRFNDLRIMFDHNHGAAGIPQFSQGSEQA